MTPGGLTLVRVLVQGINVGRLDYAGTTLDNARGLLEVTRRILVTGEVSASASTDFVGRGVGCLYE